MHVDIERKSGWKRTLKIQLTDEEVRAEMSVLLREFRKKTNLPGFRKGKVPEEIIQRRFGDYLEQELLDRLIPRAYREALEQADLDPIAQGEIRDFTYKKGEPLSFSADVEIRPTLEPEGLDTLKAVRRTFEIPDADIEHTIEAIRDRHATFTPVDRAAAAGDRLEIRLGEAGDDEREPGEPEGEPTHLELGSEGLLPAFDEGLTGAKAGEIREIQVSYPDDHSNETLRGQTRRFKVEVLETAEKKLPDLDDNLAKELGIESIDGLRTRIRLRLEGEEMMRAQREVEETVVRQLVERNTFDPPEVMVENLLESLSKDFEVPEGEIEGFRQRQREAAGRTVRRMLLLDAIATREKLEASDEEVEAAVTEGIEDPRHRARTLKKAREDGTLRRVRHQLRERKTLDFLLERAEIEEVKAKRPEAPAAAAEGG